MGEPLFLRMKRVISAGVEGAVDKAERAAAPSLMRHSIREIEQLIDRARADQAAAKKRAVGTVADQKALRGQIAELGEQARFAIEKDRADLAEAVLTRQVEVEGQLARLDEVRAESARAIAGLEATVGTLAARKAEMDGEFSTFEAARRETGPSGADPTSGAKMEQRIERSRQAFDRAMAASDKTDPGAREVAEIEAIKRESLVAERLAGLRAGTSGSKSKKRAGR